MGMGQSALDTAYNWYLAARGQKANLSNYAAKKAQEAAENERLKHNMGNVIEKFGKDTSRALAQTEWE